tara:strand:+ start:584 stop:1198 length:615 start_codon:yes stop_codon:yes gene_type:complete
MRNRAPFYFIILLGFAILTNSSFGQLPSRSELLLEKYDADRAKGIASLNTRYIASLEKELDIAMAAKKLDEANWIQLKIQSLKDEVRTLEKSVDPVTTETKEKTKTDDFLVGKSIGFPYKDDPSKNGYFSFQDEGKALWLGMKNQSVPREYKPTGKEREYLLTWPGREDGFGTYLITVAADGKTAILVERRNNYSSTGIIEKAD